MKKLCKRGLCLILIFSLVNIHSPILEASTTGKTIMAQLSRQKFDVFIMN